MSERKSNWDKLVNLPNEYEVNPDLANSAIEAIEREQRQPKRSWWASYWKKTAVAAAGVALSAAFGFFLLPKLFPPSVEPPVYYANEAVRAEKLTDVDAFATENNLQVEYFSLPNTTTEVAIISETQDIAYLDQQTIYIGSGSFDKVILRAVVLQNAVFDFESDYEKLSESLTYMDLNVSYGEKEKVTGDNPKVLACFEKDGVKYYLEIQTSGDAAEKVEQYVSMLLA